VVLANELSHKSEKASMFTGEDVWTIAFSPPDGKYLAVGFCKFEIQIWDWATK
jgi:WD40 repeat protein